MNVVYKAIRGVMSGVGFGLRVFALTFLIVDLGYVLLLSAVAVWIAADGSWVRGVLAGIVAVVAGLVVGTIVGLKFAVMRAAKAAVREAGLGKLALDAIVEQVPVQRESGWTLREIENGVNRGATRLLGKSPEPGVGGLAYWLAMRVQRVVVWATVRLIVRQASRDHVEGRRVDLMAVRDRLASVIDRKVLEHVQHKVLLVGLSLMSLTAGVVSLVAFVIRQLPI